MDPVAVIYDQACHAWLHFKHPEKIISAHQIDDVIPALEKIKTYVNQQKSYAVGFVSYEAANAFDDALVTHKSDSFPLLWFAIYNQAHDYTLPAVPRQADALDLACDWTPSMTEKDYHAAIKRIKNYIQNGDTYQVNFTLRLKKHFTEIPFEFFLNMVRAQKAAYPAYINTEDWTVASASPELFFTADDESVITRPMKGTIERGLTWDEDQKNREYLLSSEKEKAENLMIVDMARNDLGRIAETGSVNVPGLFTAEKYPTVWQMTSDVQCRSHASLPDIFRALFPAASITGAPKSRTMEIVKELETTPRKIYTGTIGFITPENRAQFNVAIRTLLLDKKTSEAEFGTGGGIVWDSVDKAEHFELQTKARILQTFQPQFSLLETMLWTNSEGFFLLDKHLERLKKSADYFDFPVNTNSLKHKLLDEAQNKNMESAKVRLLLHHDGNFEYEFQPFSGNLQKTSPLQVSMAKSPVDPSNVFLYHKTTYREPYKQAKAECPGFDDVILYNTNNEITETSIANIVVKFNGTFYTPPVKCGLLNGVFRQHLLDQGTVREKQLTVNELKNSEDIYLINSVRKWQSAQLVM